MIRTIQSLNFRVHSPSLYELVSVRDDVDDPDARVYVRYTKHAWVIHYRSSRTEVFRPFKSRDAAIQLIADRRP